MRILALALLIGLSACAISTQRYYLPEDDNYAQSGTACGFVPWGRVRVPLDDSLSTALSLAPSAGRLALSMQVALPEGTTVRLTEPEFRLEDLSTGMEYVARLDRFRVGVYGRDGRPGHSEYVNADAVLEGRGRNAELAGRDTPYAKKDLFMSSAVFPTAPAAAYVLKIPAIEVNGVVHEARAIRVRLVEKTGAATCVQ